MRRTFVGGGSAPPLTLAPNATVPIIRFSYPGAVTWTGSGPTASMWWEGGTGGALTGGVPDLPYRYSTYFTRNGAYYSGVPMVLSNNRSDDGLGSILGVSARGDMSEPNFFMVRQDANASNISSEAHGSMGAGHDNCLAFAAHNNDVIIGPAGPYNTGAGAKQMGISGAGKFFWSPNLDIYPAALADLTMERSAGGQLLIRGLASGGGLTLDTAAVNDRQRIIITGVPTGGTFPLIFSGQTASAIPYNATAATVQAALVALSNIGAGQVTCVGGPLPGNGYGSFIDIIFTGTMAATSQPLITTSAASLTGGTTPAITVTKLITGAAAGNPTLSFSGAGTVRAYLYSTALGKLHVVPEGTIAATFFSRAVAGVLGGGLSIGVNETAAVLTAAVGTSTASSVGLVVRAQAAGGQTGDLMQIQGGAGVGAILSRFGKGGRFGTRVNTAPADADVATSEAMLWYDNTDGAGKLMVKAKTANGTVVTGSVVLA